MANQITTRVSAEPVTGYRRSEEEMREWCWDKNKTARQVGWPHWLYVSRDKETGTLSCKSRSGSDATDVIKVLNGWYPDFVNWTEERLAEEHRILRHIARMGMPEEEWKVRSNRKQPA